MAEEAVKEKETLKVRISFVNLSNKKIRFERIKKYLNPSFDIERNHLVQGDPFTWGVKVKNIDKKPTPEGTISLFGIKNLDLNYFLIPDGEPKRVLAALNPDDEVTIELDSCVSFVEGALWAFLKIESNNENIVFESCQFNPYHNIDTVCEDHGDEGNWLDSIYIQKKMEILQNRTNKYVLLLTIVSVWESLFGIKKTVVNLLSGIAAILESLENSVRYILGIM
ncbi:hypothetical protein RI496_11555 [Aeromonas dhakensis]|uniref:hypothetical protein n=1 Tax=Aeromonas dhakensis TaxID=196024 RepID=UPI00344382F5